MLSRATIKKNFASGNGTLESKGRDCKRKIVYVVSPVWGFDSQLVNILVITL